MALVWSGLVVWMAVDMVGADPGDSGNNQSAASGTGVAGAPVNGQDIAILRDFAEGH